MLLLNLNQFILTCTQSDLLGMFQASLPMGIGMQQVELVSLRMFMMLADFRQAVLGLQHRCIDHQIGTSLIQGHRIE